MKAGSTSKAIPTRSCAATLNWRRFLASSCRVESDRGDSATRGLCVLLYRCIRFSFKQGIHDGIQHAWQNWSPHLTAEPWRDDFRLAWLLARQQITSVIVGARTCEQLAANLDAQDLALTSEQCARLDKVSEPSVPFLYWMQRLHDQNRVCG
ncbi:aldo/keto reductase [Paraburkholderia sp.]|uniref:aldo/keto reductase n=1 Tax=Paraburkholderia sp. TaxID=1926495 RepID=UPI002F3EBD98